jgi:hypothetical protein
VEETNFSKSLFSKREDCSSCLPGKAHFLSFGHQTLVTPVTQLVGLFFAGGGGEAFAHSFRYNTPAIMLVCFDGLAEAFGLREKISRFVRFHKRGRRLTMSSVQTVDLAFNLVQYRTCSVPELRPGKKFSICFHVNSFVSFSSRSKVSSAGVNLCFGPLGLGAGWGMPGCPTTDTGLCFSA